MPFIVSFRRVAVLAVSLIGALLILYAPAAMAQGVDMGCSPTLANPCVSSGGNSGDHSGARAAGARARGWVDCNIFGVDCPDEDSKRIERNARYDAIRARVSAAWDRNEFREVLRLLREQQTLRDGPNVLDMISSAEALIVWYDGIAAEQNKDYATAISNYRQALARKPEIFTPENRTYITNLEARLKEEQAALKKQQAAEAAAREVAERERRNRPEVDRLRVEAKAIMDTRPADALAKLDAALKLLPGDSKTVGDWWLASAALALREARYDDAIKAAQNAQDYAGDSPEVAKARARVADERNRQGANIQIAFGELRQRLAAAPNAATSVVDARNVPSGLPKAWDDAIAAAYADAPPGVSDRVRKGFQAVMSRDWKVAKAWFEDALNRDPGNVGLRRLLTALGDPPQTPTQPTTPPDGVQLPDPGEFGLFIQGLVDDNKMMDILFGLSAQSPSAQSSKTSAPESSKLEFIRN